MLHVTAPRTRPSYKSYSLGPPLPPPVNHLLPIMPFEKQVAPLRDTVKKALGECTRADSMSIKQPGHSAGHGQVSVLAAQLKMTETRFANLLMGNEFPNPAELKRVVDTVPIELSAHQVVDILNYHADVVTGSLPVHEWNEQCNVSGSRIINALHVALLIKGPMILNKLMDKNVNERGSNETLASWDMSCWDQSSMQVTASTLDELELKLICRLGRSAARHSSNSRGGHVPQEAEMLKEAALVAWKNSVYHLIDAMNRAMEAQGRTIADLAEEIEVGPADVEAVYVQAERSVD